MDDASEFLDARDKPDEFFFANLVMFRIAGLGVGFLQFLKHRALAMRPLRPNPMKAAIKPFREGPQKSDIMVVWSVKGQGEQEDARSLDGAEKRLPLADHDWTHISKCRETRRHWASTPQNIPWPLRMLGRVF